LHHVVVDQWSRRSSPVHRRDPRAKLVVLLVFLIALATATRGLALFASGLFLLLIGGLLLARVPVGRALSLAALVLPFTAIFAVVCWLADDPARGVSLALKSYLSALAVLLLISTTPLPALLRGIGMTGAPRLLLEVGQFLYRYLFVISEEAQHMTKAAAARGASVRRWMRQGQRFRASAGALAVLFARSYARAEDVHRAMLARGFHGSLPLLEAKRFRASDAVFAILASLASWVLRLTAERILP
jgi:cobalt/nickel transport system permease protein